MAKRQKRTPAVPQRQTTGINALSPDLEGLRRVIVEAVEPSVDDGRFPIKRTPGEHVIVEADVFADGHDAVAAAVLWRAQGEEAWRESPMEPIGNDRWRGRFLIGERRPYEYTVEGWIDRFGSWRDELAKKVQAGQEISNELVEGGILARAASTRASGSDRLSLAQYAAALDDAAMSAEERVARALDDQAAGLMARYPDRTQATRYERVLTVLVERERARYGAWYEMFPRSAGTDPTRSATFDDAAARLPYIASMGFDVLYLAPIHPIGRSFRKGRNNSLTPDPADPGSPWAIGAAEGGHTAIEPGLGTLDDFERFVKAARRHRLEIALDVAFQASPDHPYVEAHPEWFRHRPDGTIKYAENPPKKYQDIYPFDFESAEWRALWQELARVFEFWIERGVTIFRVDNPHTKPFRFWDWALTELRRHYPDTIFLAEAFTRPKIMRRIAKGGFSQSYTYFTWRNTKAELTEYFTELTSTPVREYMRANLFANTPDILHEYLQRGGRPAFQVRLVLAATLGASYGIYSGYELAENTPVRPGSEEYLDSEKYQIKPRDFDRADSLAEMIRRLNGIRAAHPALHFDRTLAFHPTDNDQLICYSKRMEDSSDLILVVVNLDPFHMQHGWLQLPFAEWNLAPDQTIEAVDLLSDERYYWRDRNYVRLDPVARVAHVLWLRW